jgi:hypothetical protein
LLLEEKEMREGFSESKPNHIALYTSGHFDSIQLSLSFLLHFSYQISRISRILAVFFGFVSKLALSSENYFNIVQTKAARCIAESKSQEPPNTWHEIRDRYSAQSTSSMQPLHSQWDKTKLL